MSSTQTDRQVIERHFSRRLQMDMVVDGVLVGCAVGVVITAYRTCLSYAESLLRDLIASIGNNLWGMVGWVCALMGVAYLVARLMRYEEDTRGSGIPQVDAEVIGRLDMAWHRVLWVKFVEGVLCTFAGLSLGREGPSVLLGGMAGKGVSGLLHRERGEEHLLVTCGAAAGMSAAFHAPLAGVLFALEEIHREFNAPLVISAMAAAASADFVTSQILGMQPVLHFAVVGDLPHADYAFLVVMGVICGVLGALHNVGMFAMQQHLFGSLRERMGDTVLFLPFMVSGIVAFCWPELLCGGDAILEFLEHHWDWSYVTLILLLLGKYAFTCLCFGSGAPGGTLLPLVIMGVIVGAICGTATVDVTDMPLAYLNNFIVLGVAGMFAASVRAPVTAVVLCFELVGNLDALLAATAVSLIAYLTANLLKVEPFYEHLLSNLLDSLPEPGLEIRDDVAGKKVLHTHIIGVGSIAEGRPIESVPWPEGTLVVTINRAGRRIIPRGSTYLEALDELLVIMDSEYEAETEQALHDLCGVRAHHTKQADREGIEA